MCSVAECVQLFVTPWTVVRQAPLSIEFSRQEYWSGLPFLTPKGLPDPGIKPKSPVAPALAGGFFTTVPPGEPLSRILASYFFNGGPWLVLVSESWCLHEMCLEGFLPLQFLGRI